MNRNDRAITGLVALSHAMVHTYEFVVPIFVPFWLAEFGATRLLVGVVVTVGTALFGLGSLPAGVVSDAYGSKPLIVAALAGMGGSFLILSLSPPGSAGLAVVALALVCWGLAASIHHPAGLSLISKGVTARGDAFAYHGTAGNVGTALGPLSALLLLLVFDWRVVAAVIALPALVGAVAATRIRVDETAAVADGEGEGEGGAAADGGGQGTADDGSGQGAADDDSGQGTADGGGDARATGSVSSLSEFLGDSGALFASAFVIVFLLVIAEGIYYRGILTFLPELFSEIPALRPVTFAGETFSPGDYVYTGLLMVGVGGQYVGGKLTDHVRLGTGLFAGYGVLALVALAFPFAVDGGLAPLLVCCVLLGFFVFGVQPFYQAAVAERTPAGLRGLSYGYTYLGVFGVGALGATIAGALLTYASSTEMFVGLAVFAGLASLLGLYLARN